MLQSEIRYCTTSDGVRLAVASYGSGIPVVRAGTWLTHIEFNAVDPLGQASVDAFSHGARYVFYDSRGCGLSQREVNDVSLDAWVRDLETVADALGLDRFVIYGQSTGCAIALRYARLHPGRVDRLILHGGYARHAYCSTDPALCAEADTLVRVAEVGWGLATPTFRQLFVARYMPDTTPEQQAAIGERQRLSMSPAMAALYLRAMFAVDVRDDAAAVGCPVLVTQMRGDLSVPYTMACELAGLLADARLVMLEGRNHIPHPGEPAWALLLQHWHGFLRESPLALGLTSSPQLTPRQREVLRLVASGHADKAVARALQLSPRTVEMHVAAAIRLLGCRTRTEAVVKAHQLGVL
jgi:pimeloyl-ACP methyl ester carboxylesterase/DNA-binding CsgD family transcriptional regulator